MTLIANCGHDERGQYIGGQSGDQSGTEWVVLGGWFDFGQDVVFRHPNPRVRQMIADFARSAAANDHIGYDMYQRFDFWYALTRAGYYPSEITEDCEADCSSGVAAIVKAIGVLIGDEAMAAVPISMTTFVQVATLTAAGFTAFFDDAFTRSDANLIAGDIICRQDMHTNIVVEGEGNWDVDEDILYMQQQLNVQLQRRGLPMINPTGLYNWHTMVPLIQLCQEWMLCSCDPTVAVDANWSRGWVNAMDAHPIRPGLACAAAWAVKAALIGKGCKGAALDLSTWAYTPELAAVVRQYQSEHGLPVTGIVDQHTLFSLTHEDE